MGKKKVVTGKKRDTRMGKVEVAQTGKKTKERQNRFKNQTSDHRN